MIRNSLIAIFLFGLMASQTIYSADFATQSKAPGSIIWQAKGRYSQMHLTISGPGDLYLSKTFNAPAMADFYLYDEAGMPLPDGIYSFELTLHPVIDNETRSAMKWARATGDESEIRTLRAKGKIPQRGDGKMSGHFSIMNGEIVLDEEEINGEHNETF